MATFKRFEEIEAWQKARFLCQRITEISTHSPLAKDFKLRDQINGAAGSIMDNIAEGFGRGGNYEFLQFLKISHASACEVQSQLYRVLDKKYIGQDVFDELYASAEEIKGKLLRLINYLKAATHKSPKYKDRQL